MMKLKSLLLLLSFVIASPALAGITEVSFSTSYRNQKIDDHNYTNSLSYTASMAYYFWEMSALEMSYTQGNTKQNLRAEGSTASTVATGKFKLYGLDFVLSFASKKSTVQPFIKMGLAKVDKEFLLDPADDVERVTGTQKGTSPSAGIGMRIRFSQAFSLKLGIDAWGSPIDDDSDNADTIDYAGRAGISWMF